jgi:muramoyltetrapeptide carboxypeptidase LdcA involved in peptidoglycan recycling
MSTDGTSIGLRPAPGLSDVTEGPRSAVIGSSAGMGSWSRKCGTERVDTQPLQTSRRFDESVCLDRTVTHDITVPRKAEPGDAVAIVSPSFAAPEFFPAVHEQALQRLTAITGLVPVEYPTTRKTSSPQDRARDLNEAFADPSIRAVLAVVGGEDQITVIPHLDPAAVRADPKPFLGYSDNTNILNWLWCHGVAGFYGGSTQVHLGPGPAVDACHAASLRAALITGERVEITEPGESEDIGKRWDDPAALTEYGTREATEPWLWAGPERSVNGRTWGGCVEVIQWILTAGRFPADPSIVNGGVLLLETSEEVIPAREFGWIMRSLGERGVLAAVDAIIVARPPAEDIHTKRTAAERRAHRAMQCETALEIARRYNPDAVVCVGPPFGHTRPQWIVPYGGTMTIDGTLRKIWAEYS